VSVVASLEATEGLKILLGKEQELHPQLLYVDVWAGTLDKLEVGKRAGSCPACELGRFEFLQGVRGNVE
jgi:molybdopterin/thiamine biosynthesis adenylyltransferase